MNAVTGELSDDARCYLFADQPPAEHPTPETIINNKPPGTSCGHTYH
jgi:hypothetical protein